ncbi:hypothetical protein FHS43_001941 [Streptosporangium becharense]|uniref:Uncharacterized protein n=1 Tax=Streptosporangium becharense TaxID=1816182 RepID=A0A7W9IC20_9ACTN|nr:hypothetical protein [Streptosporangium becharense]MBB2910678.1 hypothetical protein [Streptosporangium becharense]MBB5817373.1 hypothetical protein [Streptosporangium becharense]
MKVLVGALTVGAGFGALTSLINAVSHHYADLESRAATTSGVSAIEIVSVLVDSGWAWAGAAVAVGWLFTRVGESGPAALARGAAAGALALLAAVAAYSVMEVARSGEPLSSWHQEEPLLWWVTSVVFGAPLGVVGACAGRPGVIGLLTRLTVPVGAAVQMIVLPPGRNEVIEAVGRTVVWVGAAAVIAFVVVRFLGAERRRHSPAGVESL